MDNQELDQFFSEQLKATQSFDFREEDWDDVAQRLDAHDGRRRGALGWWRSLGLGALLLTLAWLSYSLYQTRQKVFELEQQQAQQTTKITDTIYKEVIIERVDTIYQTIERPRPTSENQNTTTLLNRQKGLSQTSNQTTNSPLRKLDFEAPRDVSKTTLSTNTYATNTPINLESKESTLQINHSPIADQQASIASPLIDHYPLWLPEDSLSTELLIPWKEPKTINIKPLKKQRRFRLGLEANYALVPGTSLKGQTGYGVGLIGLYTLNKRWDVFMRLSRQQLRYRVDRFDNSQLGLPSLEYLDLIQEDGNFDPGSYAGNNALTNRNRQWHNVEKSFLQYELGISYRFARRFYAAASWSAISQIDQQFGLLRFDSGEETSFAADRSSIKRLRLHRVGLQVGAIWDLGTRWQIRPEAFYYQSFDQSEDRIPNSLGLRAAILFAF